MSVTDQMYYNEIIKNIIIKHCKKFDKKKTDSVKDARRSFVNCRRQKNGFDDDDDEPY